MQAELCKFQFGQFSREFSLPSASRLPLVSIQPSNRKSIVVSFHGGKVAGEGEGSKARRTSASRAAAENAWSYTLILPYLFISLWLIKHRDSFTFEKINNQKYSQYNKVGVYLLHVSAARTIFRYEILYKTQRLVYKSQTLRTQTTPRHYVRKDLQEKPLHSESNLKVPHKHITSCHTS